MMPQEAKWVIFGSGGHALSVADVINERGWTVEAVIDPHRTRTEIFGVRVTDELPTRLKSVEIRGVVAIGDNGQRQKCARIALETFPLMSFPVLQHPSAIISRTAQVGPGSVLLQGAVVASGAVIESFAIINALASVNHECFVGNFASVGPNAALAGNSSIAELSHLGIGATLREGVRVGASSVIGANSFVAADIGSNVVAVGSPARVR